MADQLFNSFRDTDNTKIWFIARITKAVMCLVTTNKFTWNNQFSFSQNIQERKAKCILCEISFISVFTKLKNVLAEISLLQHLQLRLKNLIAPTLLENVQHCDSYSTYDYEDMQAYHSTKNSWHLKLVLECSEISRFVLKILCKLQTPPKNLACDKTV